MCLKPVRRLAHASRTSNDTPEDAKDPSSRPPPLEVLDFPRLSGGKYGGHQLSCVVLYDTLRSPDTAHATVSSTVALASENYCHLERDGSTSQFLASFAT